MALPELPFIDGAGNSLTFPAHLAADGSYSPVHSTDGTLATYSSGGTVLVAAMAATLTDLIVLRGSATKTVRVKKIRVQCGATTGATMSVLIKKHSIANTGGTAITTPDIVPFDSGDAAGTALPLVYSANPTVDASAKTLAAATLVTTALTLGPPGTVEFDFVRDAGKAAVLRGVAQELAVNFGGVTPGSGAVLNWSIIWTEESES